MDGNLANHFTRINTSEPLSEDEVKALSFDPDFEITSVIKVSPNPFDVIDDPEGLIKGRYMVIYRRKEGM